MLKPDDIILAIGARSVVLPVTLFVQGWNLGPAWGLLRHARWHCPPEQYRHSAASSCSLARCPCLKLTSSVHSHQHLQTAWMWATTARCPSATASAWTSSELPIKSVDLSWWQEFLEGAGPSRAEAVALPRCALPWLHTSAVLWVWMSLHCIFP